MSVAEQGINTTLSWADYKSHPAMNPSTLKHGLRSMKRLKRAIEGECQPDPKTVAIGNAVHCMIAGEFSDRFAIVPEFENDPANVTATGKQSKSKATSYYKQKLEQWVATETREVLTEVQAATASKIYANVRSHCGDYIDASQQEVAVFGEIAGVQMKTRLDGLNGTEVWDLKTTQDADDKAFYRRFKTLGYGFSAAVHVWLLANNGVEVTRYKIIVAEVCDDYDVRTIYVPMEAIHNWMGIVERTAQQYKTALDLNHWPGLPDTTLLIPDWDMEPTPEIDWS